MKFIHNLFLMLSVYLHIETFPNVYNAKLEKHSGNPYNKVQKDESIRQTQSIHNLFLILSVYLHIETFPNLPNPKLEKH